MSGVKIDVGDGSLIVSAKDDVKMRFYRAAILATYPGQTRAGMKLAAWMIECMDWTSGVMIRNTSVRRLVAMTKLSQSRVEAGLKELSEAGLINRTYMGGGRKGSIKVADKVAELRAGQSVNELWSDTQVSLEWGQKLDIPGVPEMGTASVPEMGTHRPHNGDSYPIPSSPEENPCCTQPALKVARHPTTEGALTTPTLKLPVPGKLKKEEPPLPPVVSATKKSRVAQATAKTQVAGATDHYGYGTEIAGLNGHTSEVVDQLVALEGGIVLDKTPAWSTVLEATRQTSPERVRAAILDIRAAQGAGKLKNRPMRVLRGFAAALTQEDAVAKLKKTEPQPFNLMRHLTDYGRRR